MSTQDHHETSPADTPADTHKLTSNRQNHSLGTHEESTMSTITRTSRSLYETPSRKAVGDQNHEQQIPHTHASKFCRWPAGFARRPFPNVRTRQEAS